MARNILAKHNNHHVGSQLTISVQSVRVGIVQCLASREFSSSRISVAEIIGSRAVHARSVGLLVQDSGGLVLSVAGRSKSRKRTEEDWAVGDEVCRWNGVGEHVG